MASRICSLSPPAAHMSTRLPVKEDALSNVLDVDPETAVVDNRKSAIHLSLKTQTTADVQKAR